MQLPSPRGLGKSAIYISTEAPLSTPRLSQLLECHPYLSGLSRDDAPTLQNVLAINAMDLETQDHILNFQLPVAISRYNVGLVVIDSITSNYRAEHTSTSIQGMSTRSWELAKLGQLLRNLAVKEDIAIVVANQVSDRFEGPEGGTNPFFRNAIAGANPLPSTPHQPQHLQPPPSSNRDTLPSPLPRHRPPESGNIELSQHNVILPSSPPAFPSSPYTFDDDPQQQPPQNFDGSYLVGNPVRNEILSLDHQQRFFTGWGDVPQSFAGGYFPGFQRSTHKTPALGMVWLTQIACRITLKKEELPLPVDPEFQPPDPNFNVKQNLPGFNPRGPAHAAEKEKADKNENHEHDNTENEPKTSIEPDLPTYTVPVLEDPEPTNPESVAVSSPAKNAIPPSSRPQGQPPSSPLPPPDRPIRRTMKLVFAPWSAGKRAATGDIQDEVEFTIEKGGMRGVI